MCINRLYNKNSFIGYELQDERGNLINCTKQMIVQILRRGDTIVNIKLLKDGRLYTNANKKQVVKSKYIRKTNKIILYHGQPNKVVKPQFGLGKDYHDYGNGFYLTPDIELAKEWAFATDKNIEGYLHTFELDLKGLNIFNFDQVSELYWIVELMQHRYPEVKGVNDQRKELIDRYGLDLSRYDVIVGWRADSAYFTIAKLFLLNQVNLEAVRKLLRIGNLGIQWVLKSRKQFNSIHEVGEPVKLDRQTYREKYKARDNKAKADAKQYKPNGKFIETEGTTLLKLLQNG